MAARVYTPSVHTREKAKISNFRCMCLWVYILWARQRCWMPMIIFYGLPERLFDKASSKKDMTTNVIHFFQALIFWHAGVGGMGDQGRLWKKNDNSVYINLHRILILWRNPYQNNFSSEIVTKNFGWISFWVFGRWVGGIKNIF